MCEIASVSSNCKDWEAQINRDSSMIDQLRQEILEKQCKLETKSLECRAIKL